MTENDIRIRARLSALDYLLANLYAVSYRTRGISLAIVKAQNAELRNLLSLTPVPGVDAAMSDMASAEFQAAVEGVLVQIEEMVAEGSKGAH